MQTPWVYLDFIFPLSPNARLVRMNYKASLVRILYIGVFLGMALPFGVTADIIADPGSPDTFESLTSEGFYTLSLETETGPLASTIQVAEPLSIQYTIGYSNKFEQHYGTTPEERTEILQTHLEDSKTYLELWKGEPFTPDAVPVQSFELSSALTGSISLEASEPGPHFLVFYFTNEVRDEAAFCVRYEVPSEDCLADWYFTRFPHEETQEYFRTPLGSYQITPDAYPISLNGTRLEVLPAGPAGISSVLFLPGIKGSRLYRPTDTCDPSVSLSCPGVKLWEPSGDVLLRDLFLTDSGVSGRRDIYVKENDILSEALGSHFYSSFVNQMNALKADGVFVDWKAVAYDWRLSLDDIVTKGVKRGDRIYFNEATDTPYIETALRELASTSATGKVSIIAHSNGGLVTKRLMQQLESEGATDLVDKIIFVGVPQSGAPQAVAGLLYGYGEALPDDRCSTAPIFGRLCSVLGSRAVARELAEHSPMAYHLLPSQAYFDQVIDPIHSVASFSGITEYFEERAKYGSSIDSAQELHEFLRAADGGRTKPEASDIIRANVLSAGLLEYGLATHQSIDAWTPPTSIEVHQIAGWGRDTVSGVDFYEQRKLFGGTKEMYRPMFVHDGDGVVPIPSALMLASGLNNVENYWVNLADSNSTLRRDDNHGTIFELESLRVLIRDILIENSLELPRFISSSKPQSIPEDRLIFFLHSPLTLELYNSEGKVTGLSKDGTLHEEIPNTEYGEFGDVKFLIAPADSYEVKLSGKGSGTFSLDVQNYLDDKIASSITFADVPTTPDTIATLSVGENLLEPTSLKVDTDGNGAIDIELTSKVDTTIIYTGPQEDTHKNNSTNFQKRTIWTEEPQDMSTSSESTYFTKFVQTPLHLIAKTLNSSQASSGSLLEQFLETSEPGELKTQGSVSETLVASVHDSAGAGLWQWIESVLYNLWKGLLHLLRL